ncbi:IS200/IS605 family accessory protein TnpB-related protein [Nonomuraea aurantiaca]|uniref:IS200/IS605 family accessory protein TnpB-related protein n=1 Tax=Nonomuraea aurantiaca TaxID=2878562 RepID=UPI001CD9C868|nr:IS200/IS605 family accessory protein TnpB-related protein [Nonomuraea aurantiaca]MCA2221750.1 IS200/IS605 family accessory protein TnpB-related protein [Nonomuraea aurantiaca]
MAEALRPIAAPFVAAGPSGVAVRDRLKGLTAQDEQVLRRVGAHLGVLASRDLAVRCRAGLEHSAQAWAERKRELTPESSSRWAGAITKASHDQWALARRCQAAHIHALEAGIATIAHRLAQPIGAKGSKKTPGGYRSTREWHAKTRRLHALSDRLRRERADYEAGRVHIVRGGKRLLNTRHHLQVAQLGETQWRGRWQAERWFLQADGESGKRYGNETIRLTPDGQVNIKLPAPLAHLANAAHGRYVLSARVCFAHRGQEWADRIEANRAVAYRIHLDIDLDIPLGGARGRWYVTASWQHQPTPIIPLQAALAGGVIGVDTNADHLAAWRLDVHGNPIGNPRHFGYDLSGAAGRRDAQVRHALTRLLHWARRCGVAAIAIEDLDFATEKTREKHGRNKRFRQLISGIPTGKLKARLTSMAQAAGISVIAVDPAYTSRWGAQHWQIPLTSPTRKTTRHDAAAVAIARRAQQYPIRRRTPPPPHDQSDRAGHRSVQAEPCAAGREETRHRTPDRAHDAPGPVTARTRATSAPNTVRGAPVQLMFTG